MTGDPCPAPDPPADDPVPPSPTRLPSEGGPRTLGCQIVNKVTPGGFEPARSTHRRNVPVRRERWALSSPSHRAGLSCRAAQPARYGLTLRLWARHRPGSTNGTIDHELRVSGHTLAVVAAAFAGNALARPVVPAEKRFDDYDGELPACDDPGVLDRIKDRFSQKETEYWNTSLEIVSYDQAKLIAARPWGADHIPRNFCPPARC